jgi:hypothetical protein
MGALKGLRHSANIRWVAVSFYRLKSESTAARTRASGNEAIAVPCHFDWRSHEPTETALLDPNGGIKIQLFRVNFQCSF